MAYKVKQAPIGARLGTGLAEGIGSQIPKEIEHYRHAKGLQSLSDQAGNLNPQQFLAKAASTYGITPQEVQSFSELAKMQNLKNAYASQSNQSNNAQNTTATGMPNNATAPNLRDIEFANLKQANQSSKIGQPQQIQQTPSVPINAYGPSQVNPNNPTNEKFLTKEPWTPEKRDQKINEYINRGFTPDQAKELASEDQRIEHGKTEANQKRYDQLEAAKERASKKLREKIEKKTQKTGENLYKDVSGNMLNNLERGMQRDLKDNPQASEDDVTNDWSERALELAKTQDKLKTLGRNTGLSNIFKRGSTLQKLDQYSDIFSRAGNAEEYQKLLESEFKLSPHAAASIAFPINTGIKNYLTTAEKKGYLEKDPSVVATQIEKLIKSEDSISSILRNLTDKFYGFDQVKFLNQLKEDQDIIQLNDRQRREIAEGLREINPPGWADLYILGR